jgi:hypothetical protein
MDATSDTIVPPRSQVCCYTIACAVEVYGMAKAQEAVPVQPALAAIVLLRSFWTTILRTETAKKYHSQASDLLHSPLPRFKNYAKRNYAGAGGYNH